MRTRRRGCGKYGLLLTMLLLAASCAKTGEPLPPRLLVPKPATDLSLQQYGDSVILRVSPPLQNTDGSAVTTLREIEVFRLKSDRSRSDRLVSEETFPEQADVILKITAQNMADYLESRAVVVRDDLSFLGDDLYKQGFFYAVRFINRKNQTAGLSNLAFIAPLPIPRSPGEVSFRISQTNISLTWTEPQRNMDGSTPPRIAGYNVYRTEGTGQFPSAPLNSSPVEVSGYEDFDFQFGRTYLYAVSVVGSGADPIAESPPSPAVRVVAKDTFPPSAPQSLDCVVEKGVAILLWIAPTEPDVVGYRIYRSESVSSGRRSLESELITILSYRDASTQVGKTYRYGVTAVDRYGNESRAAEKVVEIP